MHKNQNHAYVQSLAMYTVLLVVLSFAKFKKLQCLLKTWTFTFNCEFQIILKPKFMCNIGTSLLYLTRNEHLQKKIYRLVELL